MKLERFKERDNKRKGIIVFTIICILLVSGVMLYRTFAIFEVKTNQNVINGAVQDPGDIYFAFYKDEQIQKGMPRKEEGYVLDETKSYCGVTGQNNSNIKVFVTEDNMIHVSNVSTSRTKCNLYFVRGMYLLGKGVPIVESGEGLYEVPHGEEVSGTLNDDGFKETEYRYAGSDPNNYVNFNGEQWRIIGFVNVMTSESKVEQRVKIVKNESLGFYSWDKDKKNDWTKASLMEMLNNGYYNSLLNVTCYTNNQVSSTYASESYCDFTKNGLKKLSQMIDKDIIWNIGGTNSIQINSNKYYELERGSDTSNSQSNVWSQNNSESFSSIGLIYSSDYAYATSGGDSMNRENCLLQKLDSWNTYSECVDSSWLFHPSMALLTTNTTGDDSYVLTISARGYVGIDGSSSTRPVYPTLYLKTNVKILNDSNNGSSDNPYNLVQIFKYE